MFVYVEYACVLRTPLHGHRYTTRSTNQLEPEAVVIQSTNQSCSCNEVLESFLYQSRFCRHNYQLYSDHRFAETAIIQRTPLESTTKRTIALPTRHEGLYFLAVSFVAAGS